jgi:hypothetical protein
MATAFDFEATQAATGFAEALARADVRDGHLTSNGKLRKNDAKLRFRQ